MAESGQPPNHSGVSSVVGLESYGSSTQAALGRDHSSGTGGDVVVLPGYQVLAGQQGNEQAAPIAQLQGNRTVSAMNTPFYPSGLDVHANFEASRAGGDWQQVGVPLNDGSLPRHSTGVLHATAFPHSSHAPLVHTLSPQEQFQSSGDVPGVFVIQQHGGSSTSQQLLHPAGVPQMRVVGVSNSEHRQVCAFFLRTGTCAYGDRCKFAHPKDRPPPQLNSRGYPLRPNERDCAHYLKKGWCAFGVTCKFNHPQLDQIAAAPLVSYQIQQPGFVQVPSGLVTTVPYYVPYAGPMRPVSAQYSAAPGGLNVVPVAPNIAYGDQQPSLLGTGPQATQVHPLYSHEAGPTDIGQLTKAVEELSFMVPGSAR